MAIPPTLDLADEVIEWDGNFRYWGTKRTCRPYSAVSGAKRKTFARVSGFHPKPTLNRIR
jgi:hypothetical protein